LIKVGNKQVGVLALAHERVAELAEATEAELECRRPVSLWGWSLSGRSCLMTRTHSLGTRGSIWTMATAISARCSEQSGVANGRASSNGAMSSELVAEAE
jgi:hypothetical protein